MIIFCTRAKLGLVPSSHLMVCVDDSPHNLKGRDLVVFLIQGCYLKGHPRILKRLEFKKGPPRRLKAQKSFLKLYEERLYVDG